MARIKKTARKTTGRKFRPWLEEAEFYIYRMKPKQPFSVFLAKLHHKWENTHKHGVTHYEGINHIVRILPEPWQEWASKIAPEYYNQLWDDGSVGDIHAFIARVIGQVIEHREPPETEEDPESEPTPPFSPTVESEKEPFEDEPIEEEAMENGLVMIEQEEDEPMEEDPVEDEAVGNEADGNGLVESEVEHNLTRTVAGTLSIWIDMDSPSLYPNSPSSST